MNEAAGFLSKAWCIAKGTMVLSSEVCAAVVAPQSASTSFNIFVKLFEVSPCGPALKEIVKGDFIYPNAFSNPVMTMLAEWEYGINNTVGHCTDELCRTTLNFVISCGGDAFSVLLNGTIFDTAYEAGKAAGKEAVLKVAEAIGIPLAGLAALTTAGLFATGYNLYKMKNAQVLQAERTETRALLDTRPGVQ